jgi:hypothetical protein
MNSNNKNNILGAFYGNVANLNTPPVSNEIKLVIIKKVCNAAHSHCLDIVQTSYKTSQEITQVYFNEFIGLISSSQYSCCISPHYNSKHQEIKKFILTHSKKFKIDKFESLITYMNDNEIYDLMMNQISLEPELIDKLIKSETNTNIYYGPKTNILNTLISSQSKLKTFEYIIMLMSLKEFSNFLDKMAKNYHISVDAIINRFIVKNKDNLMKKENIHIGIKILNTFITKSNIMLNIYPLISENINSTQKREIFNKSISTYDKNLMIMMLEKNDIVLNFDTINKLVEKSYARPEGSTNSTQIASIIDLLCDYGLVIDKQIIIKLLEHGCYVNNLEKHGLSVDNDILAKCANISYYPYKFDIVPNLDILKKECSKSDNLNTIKKLKEFGGIYTSECLEEACGIVRNGRVIKYLINDCGVKISEECLVKFQDAYRIDALEALLKKYKLQNPNDKSKTDLNNDKHIDINEKSTMTVTPKNIKIIKDNTTEYILKNKIRKFFEYKKKTIKYSELHELILKYLVNNKLVIGKYFVINSELSNLLKINHCVIMNINQLHNILTYFVDLPNEN